MATKKAAYVNKSFPEEIRDEASKLIEAGKIYVGGFWGNRTKTCKRMGYDSWDSVPQQIKDCINQIGRAASKRGKERAKQQEKDKASDLPLDSKPSAKLLLSTEVLEDIALGHVLVPKATPLKEIKIIRKYITEKAGFDPKKILLGIDSCMEH